MTSRDVCGLDDLLRAELGDDWRIPIAHRVDRNDLSSLTRFAERAMRSVATQRAFLTKRLGQTAEARDAAAAERKAIALQTRAERTSPSPSHREGPISSLSGYAVRWGELYANIAIRREHLSHLLALPPPAQGQCVHLHAFFASSEAWAAFSAAAQSTIRELEKEEKVHHANIHGNGHHSTTGGQAGPATPRRTNGGSGTHGEEGPMPSCRMLWTQLELVGKMQLQVTTLLHRAEHQLRLRREATADLFRDQQKLLVWCQEQSDALNGLNTVGDLRDFCASFQSNVGVMDTNFLVLLERAESLPPNLAIREALVDVNRTWMELAVLAYTKTHRAVTESHAASHLESDCKRWADTVAPRLRRVLTETRAVCVELDAEGVPCWRALQERVGKVIKDFNAHLTIVQHLSNFSVREECVAPLEETLCNELLTRLTLLTLTFRGEPSFEGQREYNDRLRELADWVDAHSTTGAYTQLIQRVEHLRALAADQLKLIVARKEMKEMET